MKYNHLQHMINGHGIYTHFFVQYAPETLNILFVIVSIAHIAFRTFREIHTVSDAPNHSGFDSYVYPLFKHSS